MRYLTGDTCAPAAAHYPPLRSVGGESIRPSCGRSSPRFNFTSKAGSVQGRHKGAVCWFAAAWVRVRVAFGDGELCYPRDGPHGLSAV